MGNTKGLKGFRVLAVGLALAVPATALAQSVLVSPPPRDEGVPGNDAHKNASGACGNVPRTAKYVQYQAGATIEVKWKETIDHAGCFQFALSTTGDDTNFITLDQIQDDAGTPTPYEYTTMLKLPDGVTCKNCTLQLRQLMQDPNNPICAPDANPDTAGQGTYHSCADICIGTDCPPMAGSDGGSSSSSSSSSSGGPTTTPTDGGGKTVPIGGGADPGSLDSGKGDSGCSVGFGGASGASFGVAAALFGLALVRRRRNKR